MMSWSPCTRLGGCQENFLQQDFWHRLSRAVVGGSPWQLNSEYVNCQTEQSQLKLSKCNYEKQICHQRLLHTRNRIMCGESCGRVVPKEHLLVLGLLFLNTHCLNNHQQGGNLILRKILPSLSSTLCLYFTFLNLFSGGESFCSFTHLSYPMNIWL